MNKIKTMKKGAMTIEFIIVVSILVLIAGLGTAWVLSQFNNAKSKSNNLDSFDPKDPDAGLE